MSKKRTITIGEAIGRLRKAGSEHDPVFIDDGRNVEIQVSDLMNQHLPGRDRYDPAVDLKILFYGNPQAGFVAPPNRDTVLLKGTLRSMVMEREGKAHAATVVSPQVAHCAMSVEDAVKALELRGSAGDPIHALSVDGDIVGAETTPTDLADKIGGHGIAARTAICFHGRVKPGYDGPLQRLAGSLYDMVLERRGKRHGGHPMPMSKPVAATFNGQPMRLPSAGFTVQFPDGSAVESPTPAWVRVQQLRTALVNGRTAEILGEDFRLALLALEQAEILLARAQRKG